MAQTIQAVQANINDLLSDMDAGTQGTVTIVDQAGGPTVAKLVKWSTFAAADIAAARDLTYLPQLQLASGPMTNQGTDGLYKLTKVLHEAAAVPDNTVHSSYQYTNGPGGVLFTATVGGVAGDAITIELVVAGLNTPLSVAVLAQAVTVNLATDGAGLATTTMSEIVAALAASAAASALLYGTATGVASTVAGVLAVTNLAGGGNQPAGLQKFQAYPVFRKHVHSTNALVAPSKPERAVFLSATHATFLGL